VATNFYFNNFTSSQEQLLIENLVIESIKIYGLDVYYLPRTKIDYDGIYGEAPVSEFKNQYMVEMYVKNVDGFKGDGDFLSKFNLEIRDQITFAVARRTFAEEVGSIQGLIRPLEGDLIYFPLNNKCFEIKFVEHESVFYQLGSLQFWDITCELFEYSGEKFTTGIEELDLLYIDNSTDSSQYVLQTEDTDPFALTDEQGYKLVNENYDINTIDPTADNDEIQEESDNFVDFSERDPFSEQGVY
jgi:hypothetical protein